MSKQEMVFSRFAKDFLDKNSKFSSQEFGSICWNVGIEKWENEGKEKTTFYASHALRISDCNRSITLDMTADLPEEYDLRIHKVDEIIKSLESLKVALKEAKAFVQDNNIKTE